MATNPSSPFGRKTPIELFVGVYLLAIVLANLVVSTHGQKALVLTGLVLIPIDFLTRDILHGRWSGAMLWPKMLLLIIVGAIATSLCNNGATEVARASVIAFFFAGVADTIAYEWLKGFVKSFRMNASNLAAAIVDSILFPILAFGDINPWLSLSQVALKFFGGLMFTAYYRRNLLED